MKLTFWGASRQVTGSMYLLELASGYKILIDCGTDYDARHQPVTSPLFPCLPSEIDIMLLTHAHLDHTGNIPSLIQSGFKGKIVCTAPTFDLTSILLRDSAALNLKRVKQMEMGNSKMKRRLEDSEKTMYFEKQADEALEQFRTIAFNTRKELTNNVFITFLPAGHLLGAATIFIENEEGPESKSIIFSGDIGRNNYPLLEDPSPIPQADYLVCESTYGSRLHSDKEHPEDEVEEVIISTCVSQSGRLIIPAFSIGRTQTLLYILNKLYLQKRLPPVKVFSDSPMAENCTRIYEKYHDWLNPEAKNIFKEHGSLFDFDNLVQVTNEKESKAISSHTEPCIIVSSSGMITGGRMQHHIKKNINNPYCTVLVIGYSAEGTPGYELTNGNRSIRIQGKEIPIAARIVTTDVFSGHADQKGLIDFVKKQSTQKLKRIFLVHGEYSSMKVFKEALSQEGFDKVEMPEKGNVYEL
ncbi:MAG TPA: MBL fold metallo-hydrolase [Cytophagaceae bacterium]|jgi:metallo-beta-lactamase family protein